MANIREREIPCWYPPPSILLISDFSNLSKPYDFSDLSNFGGPTLCIWSGQLSLSAFVQFSLHIKGQVSIEHSVSLFHQKLAFAPQIWQTQDGYSPSQSPLSSYSLNFFQVWLAKVLWIPWSIEFPANKRDNWPAVHFRIGSLEFTLKGGGDSKQVLVAENLQPLEIGYLPSMLALLFASPFSLVSSRCSTR